MAATGTMMWDAPNFTATPTEYVKRQCFVSVDCDEEPTKDTVDCRRLAPSALRTE